MNSPLLGVDIGKRRTGLALSENGLFATPLGTIESKGHASHTVAELLKKVADLGIRTVVVGLPLSEDGDHNPQSEWVETVIDALRQSLPAPVNLATYDEYNSTQEGLRSFSDRVSNDAAAAAVLLQQYIDDHAEDHS